MTYQYFAYGSNLDAAHFADWCREHGYVGKSLDDGTPAVLDDYELVLSVPSRYWGGGVGTVAPKAGGVVHGVLFSLPDGDADMIRHKEGVGSGLYREIEAEVRLGSGSLGTTMADLVDQAFGGSAGGGLPETTLQLVNAHVFVAVEARTVSPPPAPSRRWQETVARGAQAFGLPRSWIDSLAQL